MEISRVHGNQAHPKMSANKTVDTTSEVESEDEAINYSQVLAKNIEDNRRFLTELGFPPKSHEDNTINTERNSQDTKCKRRKRRRVSTSSRTSLTRDCKKTSCYYEKKKAKVKKYDYPELNSPLFKVPEIECRRKIRVLSLFDGIGSGIVALKSLGIRVEVYFTSEINGKADLVTRLNHHVIPLGNILEIGRELLEQISPIDLLLAGPPCNDLSVVNHRRKGFQGSGKYIFKFLSILKELENINHEKRPTFWLLENTGHMLVKYKEVINDILSREPVRCDAMHFTGMRRARSFWGNIPNMCSTTFNTCPNRKTLDDIISHSRSKRRAMVPYARTITTSSNSLSIKNGVKGGLVIDNGKQCDLSVGELERLFGLPLNYTGVQYINDDERRTMIGRAWCIPVLQHLLLPLKHYFRTKNPKRIDKK